MVKKYLGKAGAPTIAVTLIFFLNYYFFGMENTLIGPFLTLSFIKFKDMEHYQGSMLKSFGIYGTMAVFAWLALLHPVMNVFINGLALFWIGYFLIDEYKPLNYFPAGMALIFFQISPVSGTGVLKRILALTVSFFLVFLLLEIIRWFKRKEKMQLDVLVEQGLEISHQMIRSLAGKDKGTDHLRYKLCQTNRNISLALYESNRSAIGKKVGANRYSDYIACFQMMYYLANQISKGDVGDGAVQLEQMKVLVKEFNTENKKRNWESSADKYRFRENPLDLRSFRLRFALRLLFVVTPCLAFGQACSWPNSYWLAISVFFMMIPVYENTFARVAQRISGTVIGVVLCLAAFFFFRVFWARVILMTMANFFLYCSGSYTLMVACITCSALSLNFGTDFYVTMLAHRLLYTLAGAAIAITANLLIFRIRAWRQCQYVMELLDDIKGRMKEASGLPKEKKNHIMGQYMIKSYLLTSRMEEFNEAASEENKREDIEAFLMEHIVFTSRLMLSEYLMDEIRNSTTKGR